MTTYVEYDLGNGATILIEGPAETSDLIAQSPKEGDENVELKAKKSFTDALKDVKTQAKLLLKEIEEIHVYEAEIKFGINTIGELGNMAIGKVGVGVNYEVTLKWKKPESDSSN